MGRGGQHGRHGAMGKAAGSYHEEEKMHWVVVFRGTNERQQRQSVWLDAGSLELWTVDSVSGDTGALEACDWSNVLSWPWPTGPALSFASNRSAASQVRCRELCSELWKPHVRLAQRQGPGENKEVGGGQDPSDRLVSLLS